MSTVIEAEQRGDISFMRQRDWFDPQKHRTANVQVIGCGGIGSHAAMAAAKLGIPSIELLDPDLVEAHNVPNQMFPLEAIGISKVDALAHEINRYAVSRVNGVIGKVTEEECQLELDGVVISALDSMEARANLWKHSKGNWKVPLLIDARLGGQKIRVLTVDPLDSASCERYEETLHTDGEALPDPCTARSVWHVGLFVSGLITRLLVQHFNKRELEPEVYFDAEPLFLLTGK